MEVFIMALWVVMAACMIGSAFSLFMLFRNEWVYRQRKRAISELYGVPTAQWMARGWRRGFENPERNRSVRANYQGTPR